MPSIFIKKVEEFEHENGARLVVFQVRRKKKKNLLKNMMIDGIEIAIEAAVATYTWESNHLPALPLVSSAMGAVSAVDLLVNARRYIRKLPRLQRYRLRLSCYLATGVITYFSTIHAFSELLKCNNKGWILCLGLATSGYFLAASSVTKLGRTVLNRTPLMKCSQLLFGPGLITSAAYYLLSFRQHDEEWLRVLLMFASVLLANHISIVGINRVESNNEPRWLLFKGLEMFIGGCLNIMSGAVLVIYTVNNQFNPIVSLLCTIMIHDGITDIINSLRSFQRCVEMEAPVFYCICEMIGGPFVFLSAFLGVRCIDHPIMLPAFVVTSGIGLTILGRGVMNLYDLVPQPVFKRYCQRVLGPVATVCSSLVAAYVGYSMGWRFSLVTLPLM